MVKNLITIIIIMGLITIVAMNVLGNEKETTKTAETAKKTETAATNDKEDTTYQVEYVAPDFKLKTLEGETVRLSDYVGKKVILNFWATWCPPCKEEVPHMQKIYEEYKNQGVEILAVNVTNKDKGEEAAAQFVKEHGLTFEVLLDEEGFAGSTYQVLSLPTTYMIDTKGNMIDIIEGPMNEALMKELINKAE
ncbi:TlpA family protein disulfide reductase [Viridibacillus sp. YIM B01967]|uniref:TlpA family protein disulfide reductase n=1 Tax=Viridibacillus soli TaxID=2798301 RepID=A0ABS1HBK5_9BACL|nr:TlpA disulfide reductase family protein [Viridibacillus soli]MBK3496783.1 TlpA family protein disulfide reductase [Viridibacillus soli]